MHVPTMGVLEGGGGVEGNPPFLTDIMREGYTRTGAGVRLGLEYYPWLRKASWHAGNIL